jgi:hypothetical protein
MAWSNFIVGIALALLPVAAAAASGEIKVVVLEAHPTDLPDLGSPALREAVVGAIKAQGATVVDAPGISREQAACTTPGCYKSVAETAQATHVLRIDGSFTDDRYELQIQIWNRQTGEIVSSDRDRCKLCLADDMLRIARNQTAFVLGKALTGESARASDQLPPVPPLLTEPDRRPTLDRPGFQESERHHQFHRPLAWTLIGAGVVASVAGVLLWRVDGDPRDCNRQASSDVCPNLWDTKKAGIPLLVGGVVSAAVGGWLLYSSSSGERVALSPTPGGLMAFGRY